MSLSSFSSEVAVDISQNAFFTEETRTEIHFDEAVVLVKCFFVLLTSFGEQMSDDCPDRHSENRSWALTFGTRLDNSALGSLVSAAGVSFS